MTLLPGSHARGFTLLEILVAMTLLGLVMAIAFGGLQFGTRVWEAGEVRLDQRARLIGAQRIMRDMLGRLNPRGVSVSADESQAVTGTHNRIQFTALVSRNPELAGFHCIEFALDNGIGLPNLVVRDSFLDEQQGTAPRCEITDANDVSTAVLVERVEAITFGYFGRREGDDEPTWHDEWAEMAAPNLIRLSVRLADGDDRVWPELTVAPRLVAPLEVPNR